jgi:hypothetical protein
MKLIAAGVTSRHQAQLLCRQNEAFGATMNDSALINKRLAKKKTAQRCHRYD